MLHLFFCIAIGRPCQRTGTSAQYSLTVMEGYCFVFTRPMGAWKIFLSAWGSEQEGIVLLANGLIRKNQEDDTTLWEKA